MKYLILIVTAFILSSCEYELDKENFVKINPPASTHEINLELVPQSDTINIFNYSNIGYSFNTFGLEIIKVVFTLENKTWISSSSSGSIDIYPNQFSTGIHQLVAEVYTHSGTGSVGDISGTEGYYSKKSWIVLTDCRMAPVLTMSTSITKEGHLKISWDKCNQFNFYSYTLQCPNLSKHIFNYANSTYYIDTNFVGGNLYYYLICKVYTSDNIYAQNWSSANLTTNYQYPTIQFHEVGLDSLKVYWLPSIFKCRYDLSEGISILTGSTDTSIIVPRPPYNQWFNLNTIPYNNISDIDKMYYKCSDTKLFIAN